MVWYHDVYLTHKYCAKCAIWLSLAYKTPRVTAITNELFLKSKPLLDAGKRIRLNPVLYFEIATLKDFWQSHREGLFSFADTVALLKDFYDQFYEKCKEDFKK